MLLSFNYSLTHSYCYLFRRVQAAYLRQLWDDNYLAFKSYDQEEDKRHYMVSI